MEGERTGEEGGNSGKWGWVSASNHKASCLASPTLFKISSPLELYTETHLSDGFGESEAVSGSCAAAAATPA